MQKIAFRVVCTRNVLQEEPDTLFPLCFTDFNQAQPVVAFSIQRVKMKNEFRRNHLCVNFGSCDPARKH